MHGELALGWQRKVHDGEHGLFNHTAIVGTSNNETDLVLDVHDYGAFAGGAIALWVAME